MSCPKNCQLVTTECNKIASAMGKKFKGAGCHETEVRGCYANGPNVYFSTCAKDFTKQNHAAVCKCSRPL